MVPKRCWPERSLCTDTAEVSDTFHMCGGIMYLLVCGVHGWIWCSKITKRVPRHVTHMHRYMAVPRTPVQTDRLDTTEASAVYRATRDRQVIKGATRQMSYFVFQQGELHKSEKRATSSGGGLRFISTITAMLQCY